MISSDAFKALKSASAELRALGRKIKENRTRSHAIPAVTLEWRELNREFDSLQKEWNEVYRQFAEASYEFLRFFDR
jgi:hypothetical protein